MLICCNRGQFFLIFPSLRAKLLTPDWSSGESTRFSLAEHASSTFDWFLRFVSKNNEFFQVFWSSIGNQVLQLERKFLSVKFSCLLQETEKVYLCQS